MTKAPDASPPDEGRIYDEPLTRALGSRYLAYAISTLTHRALPDVRDGLKPVHRRVLYAMRQLRLDPSTGYKKSARVVGDVIGKYHPHGEASVYDAMVRLAQDFSTRYPLVDGQGNFGNIDGDSAAAQRYTEARLTEVGAALMDGLDEDGADMRPTYDGSESEPEVMPAAFPNLLANGASGIAVGMAASVPPHNAGEICDALAVLLKNPKTPLEELIALMPGPDFPTGGVLVEPAEAIREAYRTGRGGFRLRARWRTEDLGRGQWRIVVTEIPYQVQKAKLIERLASLIEDKKSPLLADVRDESAEDVRVVLEPKSRAAAPEALMEALFKQTDLEVRFPLNMNVLDSRRTPRVMPLNEVLQSFLDHRREVLLRRSNHRLTKLRARLELVEGFLIAYLNLDRLIEILRGEEEPKPLMMAEFGLTETQAEAILNMRLRSLRKLEEMELKTERAELLKENEELSALVESPAKQNSRLAAEIRETKRRFGPTAKGGARRTEIAEAPNVAAPPPEAFIEREPVTVILSEKGWIRAMKGHLAADFEAKHRDGDKEAFRLHAETTDTLVAFAASGKAYALAADKLPGGRSLGEPVRLMADLAQEDEIVALFVPRPEGKRLLASSDGRGFVVSETGMLAQTRAGRQVLTPDEGAKARVCAAVEGDHVAVAGSNRKLLVFPLEQIPEMTRGKGVTLQRYKGADLADARTLNLAEGLSWRESGGRQRVEPDLTAWLGTRGAAGSIAPRGFPRDNKFA